MPPTAPCSDTLPTVPAVSVSAFAPLIVLPVPLKVMFAPAAVPPALVVSMIEVVPAKVTGAPSNTAAPAVRNCPFKVTPLGAVAVTPAVNSSTSVAAAPSASVPVFEKVTVLVMVAPPLIATL